MQVGPATENAEENAKEKLGEILVREGWITAEQRDWATEVQERTGCRLGAILVAAGLIRRDAVYRVLARTWDCEFVDLVNTPLDLSLLDGLDPHLLAEEGWIPYGRDGERILVATSERPTLERQRSILDRLCAPVSLVVTTDWDILQSLNTAFRETVVEQATLGLWRRDRMQSARQVLLAGQRVWLGLLLAGLVAGLVLAPRTTVAVLSAALSLAFLAAVLFKFVVCLVGARHENRVTGSTTRTSPRSTDRDLPIVHGARAGVRGGQRRRRPDRQPRRARLPAREARDPPAARGGRHRDHRGGAGGPATVDDHVPASCRAGHPQTKPKACNVGLFFARGEFLVIYDAEDRPEPDQLKKAVIAFRRGGDRLVCVQAALNYWNAERELRSPGCSPSSTRSGSTTCSRASTGCACRSRSAARRTTSAPAACASSVAGTRST